MYPKSILVSLMILIVRMFLQVLQILSKEQVVEGKNRNVVDTFVDMFCKCASFLLQVLP
jgi:hypothetical protein